jgi:hypothetical protein
MASDLGLGYHLVRALLAFEPALRRERHLEVIAGQRSRSHEKQPEIGVGMIPVLESFIDRALLDHAQLEKHVCEGSPLC